MANVAGEILSQCRMSGSMCTRVTNATIALRIGFSTRQVTRAIAVLMDANIIRCSMSQDRQSRLIELLTSRTGRPEVKSVPNGPPKRQRPVPRMEQVFDDDDNPFADQG